MKLFSRITKSLLFALGCSMLVPACTFTPGTQAVKLQMSLFSGAWNSTGASGRFLTPEVSQVFVEAHEGAATGPLLSSSIFPVTGSGLNTVANGILAGLPVGKSVVILAEVRDETNTAIARATSDAKTLTAGMSAISLTLLPLPSHPALAEFSVADISESFDVLANQTVILHVGDVNQTVRFLWAVTTAPYSTLLYQVRGSDGAVLAPTLLADDAGIEFTTGPAGAYVLFYNPTATGVNLPLSIQATTLPATLVVVNSLGDFYWTTDGTTWAGGVNVGLDAAYDITYGNGMWVVAGSYGGQYAVAVASEVNSWTTYPIAGTSGHLYSVEVNPSNVFVAAGLSGASIDIASSDDGTGWAVSAAGVMAGGSTGVAWNGSGWFIGNSSFSTVKSATTDLTTWTSTGGAPAGGFYQANALVGLNGRLIVGGGQPSNTGKQTSMSINSGYTWTTIQTLSGSTDYVNAFAYNPTTYRVVLAGSGTSNQVYYSDDYGVNWYASSVPVSNTMTAVAYWNGGFILGDAGGNYYPSPDGATFNSGSKLGSSPLVGFAARD